MLLFGYPSLEWRSDLPESAHSASSYLLGAGAASTRPRALCATVVHVSVATLSSEPVCRVPASVKPSSAACTRWIPRTSWTASQFNLAMRTSHRELETLSMNLIQDPLTS
jgi:hypothetical protein